MVHIETLTHRIDTADKSVGIDVEVDGVTKSYVTAKDGTVRALDRVSLSLDAGEFVSIVGPSGCGKSTLMMLIAGLIAASSGTIRVGGRAVSKPIDSAGIVFQRDVLLEWRSVLSNVMLPIQIKGLDCATYEKDARELLRLVGLQGYENKFPSELSGGMRQRVSICRALLQRPGLLLMDEPFGALDSLTREQMNLDLQRIWERDRSTVLFITHSIEEAVFLSHRVVVMSSRPGKIIDVVDVDLNRPRAGHTRRDPDFLKHVDRIRRCFMAQGILSEV